MVTEETAALVDSIRYDRLPKKAIDIAKLCMLDCLGCGLAGLAEPAAGTITRYVQSLGGTPVAPVIGGGFSTSPTLAALANGTITHLLDYDDYAITSACHPTVVLLPSILALAQQQGFGGRQIIEAYVAGWEIGSRLGREISPLLQQRGWHPTSTIGTLAAAGACAKLLGFDEAQTRKALGMAASGAAGLSQNFGTDTKPIHAGNAAANAIQSVMLVGAGMSANPSIMDSATGLSNLLSGKECPAGVMMRSADELDLVNQYAVKPYPSCGLTHRCIEALLTLMNAHRFAASDVATITCHVPPVFRKLMPYPRPETNLQAKFSLEYCIAVTLLEGEVTLRQFDQAHLRSETIKAVLPKVEWKLLEGVEGKNIVAIPQAVTVKLADGTEYFHEVAWAKGTASNPMTWDEISRKFASCASGVIPEADATRVVDLMSRFESLESVDELMGILCRMPG